MYQHQVCVCVCVQRESLDTKLCFQLNNSAPFQQYQDPRGREQKRKQAEGRRKEWRELVAQRTAVIILPVLSAECSCHISVDTELKDECSLHSFSLFHSDSYRYRIVYLYHFPALASSRKTKYPNPFLSWSTPIHLWFPHKNGIQICKLVFMDLFTDLLSQYIQASKCNYIFSSLRIQLYWVCEFPACTAALINYVVIVLLFFVVFLHLFFIYTWSVDSLFDL